MVKDTIRLLGVDKFDYVIMTFEQNITQVSS